MTLPVSGRKDGSRFWSLSRWWIRKKAEGRKGLREDLVTPKSRRFAGRLLRPLILTILATLAVLLYGRPFKQKTTDNRVPEPPLQDVDFTVGTGEYAYDRGAKNPVTKGRTNPSLPHLDSVFDKFCEYCQEAGRTCPLAAGGSNTKTQFQQLLPALKTSPIAVPASSVRGPEIITYTDVRALVRNALYSPMAMFTTMAQLTSDLSQNNSSSFADYKYEARKQACRQAHEYGSSSEGCNVPGNSFLEISMSIVCTDGMDSNGMTKMQYHQYWNTLHGQSAIIGDWWAAGPKASHPF
ncbi:hypothetical protein BBP40_005797 [Aspergillus hancockii]|nr:hypothetical protein BBP40_005797 [Aspergillus hancockii]